MLLLRNGMAPVDGPVPGRALSALASGVLRLGRGLRRRSPPATGVAQIAEIAQISKTSMKWASAQDRDVPPIIAQIAEISLRPAGQPIDMWWSNVGLLENAITVITEKRLESVRSHNGLRVSALPTARRFAPAAMNSNPWGIDLHPNTNEPKTGTEITETTEIHADTIPCVAHFGSTVSFKRAVHLEQAGGNCGNAQIPQTSTEWASARCRAVWRKSAEVSLKYPLSAPRGVYPEVLEGRSGPDDGKWPNAIALRMTGEDEK